MIKQHRAATPLKALAIAAACAAAFAVATPASAATYSDVEIGDPNDSILTGDFGNNLAQAGTTDYFQFSFIPQAGDLSVSGSTFVPISLASVTVNGVAVQNLQTDSSGQFSFFFAVTQLVQNPLTIAIGYGGTGSGSFSARFSFDAAGDTPAVGSPVPGPIAGAGIPAAFAFGGLLWARRRKAATVAA